jgi:CRP/FNR family transcriptional regulator, cyclic AMP receptor protein
MARPSKTATLKQMHFVSDLDEKELALVGKLCQEGNFSSGELCQNQNQALININWIVEGLVGVEYHLEGVAYGSKEIILATYKPGDMFGWQGLIKGSVPWSNIRALEPTRVLYAAIPDLLKLCETNQHIGYVLMKNLAILIAGRLRQNRMSTLEAIMALKG